MKHRILVLVETYGRPVEAPDDGHLLMNLSSLKFLRWDGGSDTIEAEDLARHITWYSHPNYAKPIPTVPLERKAYDDDTIRTDRS